MKKIELGEPIAIVSMACRYPQCETPEAFWDLIINSIDTVTEVPKSRWNMDSYYDSDKNAPNKSHCRHGAFLNGVDEFDPLFFNISPREAQDMRPEQKMMLELTWQAVERAKIPYSQFEGSHTGVYTGVIWDDFEHLRRQKNAPVTQHSALGQSPNVIAGRVSYFFGLTGPSLNVDTGCSASLVAMQIACQSLKEGSIDMAVVGGLNVILDPGVHVLMSKFGGLSAAGRCFTFDERADGFVRGEGGAVFLLKRLSDARRDSNPVLAIIKSIAVNNNGFNENLPATSAKGQLQMLEFAYSNAKVNPADVQFVETHGTGTKVGDPNETRALGEFFSINREASKPLRIGSVKTVIGHQEGGAATAGLAKMVLAIQNKTYPPNLHFVTPNPLIDFEGLKLKVQTQIEPWVVEEGKPRIAGVNSFGWVGTNAHIVIEEDLQANKNIGFKIDRDFFVLPISAKTEQALRSYVKSFYHHLNEHVGNTREELYRFCASAALLKPHFEYRTAFVGSQKADIVADMEEFLSNEYTPLEPIRLKGEKKIAFVFPGQGSQRVGMGRTMYEHEPVFRQTINEFDAAYRPLTGWSLVDEIFANESKSRLSDIDVIQPVIAAVQCALAKMMIDRGVVPHTVLGHSMGEVAAAYIAGILHIDDAAKIICYRSQLMKTQRGKGGMALTELTYNQAEELVKNYGGRVSVAVSNSPKSTVLAGDSQDILQIVAELEDRGLFARKVNVDVASHSPQMDVLMEPLRNLIEGIEPRDSAINYFSPVYNRKIDGHELSPDYWVHNLRQPVQFSSAVSKLLDDKHVLFIEISSNPILTTSIDQCLQPHHEDVVIIDTLRKETHEVLESTRDLADFYIQGCNINWKAIYGDFRAFVDLPTYPWRKARYALEDHSEDSFSPISDQTPLLGKKVDLAGMDELDFWHCAISEQNFAYLQGHVVGGEPVLPGAAYIEALIELGSQEFGSFVIKNMVLNQIVLLDQPQNLQIKVRTKPHKTKEVEFFNNNKKFLQWKQVGQAQIAQHTFHKPLEPLPVAGMLYRFDLAYKGEQYYALLRRIELGYKDQFACIEEVYRLENQSLVKIKPIASLAQSLHRYCLHPAVLDMALQSGFALMDLEQVGSGKTAVVESVGEIIFYQKIDLQEFYYACCTKKETNFTVTLTDAKGRIYAKIKDLVLSLVDKNVLFNQTAAGIKDWLFTTQWMPRETASKQFNRRKVAALGHKWLILGEANSLVQNFKINNLEVFQVLPSEDYRFDWDTQTGSLSPSNHLHFERLFDDLAANGWQDIAGMVHAFTIQEPIDTNDDLSTSHIAEKQRIGTISLMALAKALRGRDFKPMVKILTKMAQPVGEHLNAESLNISQFPLWAMARTFANEFAELECRRFDIGAANNSWKEISDEILYGDLNEKEIAFRGKEQYVCRLVNYYDQVASIGDGIKFDPQAIYLVTGFRGLASIFVKWMFERGARNFVMTSRSGSASAQVERMISDWQQQGASVQVVKADVSREQGLGVVFEVIKSSGLPLKGIIHAAGLAQAGLLSEIGDSEFEQITAPKIAGTWLLHQYSLAHPIEWFVLFSSPTIFFGTNGQGHYVAGNMFLDAVAQYRHLKGLPAISVNWGLVTEVGMAANIEDIDRYARQEGFVPIQMAEAVEVFGKVHQPDQVHIGILKLDIEQLKNYYPVWSNSNFLLEVAKDTSSQAEQTDIVLMLTKLKSAQERITALEEFLKSKLSKLLKMQPSDLKPSANFKSLGVDSLTAVQFRSQLDKALSLKLPLKSIWSHPTIGQFAAYLNNELFDKQTDMSALEHRWWTIAQPKATAKRRLFCFHGAGQSASMFLGWDEKFDHATELVALELPGRSEGQQPDQKTIHEIIDALLPEMQALLDKPFAFFGHSFGGLLAFETLKKLTEKDASKPEHFFVSASLPPFLVESKRTAVIAALADDNLGLHFPELNSLEDSELKQLTTRLLKHDFKLIEAYEYDPFPLFEVPTTAFAAKHDLLIAAEDVKEWGRITSKSFSFYELDKHHNFIDNEPDIVISTIKTNWL